MALEGDDHVGNVEREKFVVFMAVLVYLASARGFSVPSCRAQAQAQAPEEGKGRMSGRLGKSLDCWCKLVQDRCSPIPFHSISFHFVPSIFSL